MVTKNQRMLIREANNILGMGSITNVYPFNWKPPAEEKVKKVNKGKKDSHDKTNFTI